MKLAELLPYLQNVRKRGNQFTAACPICHDTHHLYVKEQDDKVLLFCQKCKADFVKIVKELNIPMPKNETAAPKIAEQYDHEYHNTDGTISYYKTRIKYTNGKKKFVFWHYANGKKVYAKPSECNSLYNLHLMQSADATTTLYIVEGEKCADACTKNGLLATTTNTGAGGKVKFSLTDKQLLAKFKQQVVIPDNDDVGREYAKNWPEANVLNLAEVWPEIKEKQDIADYIEAGKDIASIKNFSFKTFKDYTIEELLAEETFAKLLAIKDDFKRKQAESSCEARARDCNRLKDYLGLYKAYKISLAKRFQNSQGKQTDFPGQPITLACGEWLADGFGIKKNKITVNGDVQVETASPIPVLPLEILYNLDSNEEKITLGYFKDGRWRNMTCDRVTCASNNKIIELANKGLEVNSENAKLLVRYIADCVALNLEVLPRAKSISRLGWIGKDFIPYNTDIKFDGERNFKPLFDAVASKGELEAWTEYVKPLRKNIYLRMTMAASFASPLIELVNALPFVFHLWGGTGSGKTVALMVAMSIWGDPRMGKMVRTMNMTINSMMSTAAFLCHLPFAGDELQTIKKRGESYDTLIMRITEGIDRGRMSYSALEEMRTWKCSFLFTGEEPCTRSASGGGVKNRVIEHECTDLIVAKGNEVVAFINEHYGQAGMDFIGALRKRKLQDEYSIIFDNIINNIDTTEKQAMAVALMMLADQIASELFFAGEAKLTLADVKSMLLTKADVDVTERAYEFVMSMVAKNINKFKEDTNGEVWGKITSSGLIYINKEVLMQEMGNAGFEFDAMKRKWAEKGYLITNSQGRLLHNTRCGGVKASYIVMKNIEKTEPIKEKSENEKIEEELPF